MERNRKLLIINIVALVAIIGLTLLYACVGQPYIYKSATSLWFVITGVVNFVLAYKLGFPENKYKKFAIFMLVGLIFAMAGDIVLIDFFEIGAGLFAVGHICFFVAYLMLSKFNIRDMISSILLFGACLLVIFLYDGFVFGGIMLPVVIIYALIISLMLGKSISNLFDKNIGKFSKWLIFIGSLMFFLSDVCLLFNVFGGADRWVDMMCIFLYYPAEIVLASSIYFSSRKEN